MDNFDRGESCPITVTLQNSSSVDLDLADFDTIVVKVSHKHLGTLLGRYSAADSTITNSSPTTDGEITFTVTSTQTADAALGVYKYQVKTYDADGSPKYRTFVGDAFYLKKALT